MFKLFDFNVYNTISDECSEESETRTDQTKFYIQMFGINEHAETCSIFVEDFKPFFYVKLEKEDADELFVSQFENHIKNRIGDYYRNSIVSCELVHHKKLYGFDAGRTYPFAKFVFENTSVLNKVKNFWYLIEEDENGVKKDDRGFTIQKLLPEGYKFQRISTYIYESNIPPL